MNKPRPTHIMLHHHLTSSEEWQPWLVKASSIREVMVPGMATTEGNGGAQVWVVGRERNVVVKESPEEIAALIAGKGDA